jgi:hypothetical protein
MDPYSTHQEALRWSLNKLGSDIIAYEVGAGYYSTQLLHEAVSKSLTTIESDLDWCRKFMHFQNKTHGFIYISPENWTRDIPGLDQTADLVFIDSYDGPSRMVAANHFRDTAKIIIIHDQENVFLNRAACYENQYETVMGFKYIKQFPVEGIITAVLSNVVDLEAL